MKRKLLYIITAIAATQAFAAIDPSKLVKVTGDSNQKCVEYYTYHGESYCSETMLSEITVAANVSSIEKWNIKFDDRPWLAAWSSNTDEDTTVEYVPMGEKISSWHELITSQFFPDLQDKVTPTAFMQGEIAQMKKSGFDPVINVIKESPDTVLFEFRILSPKEQAQDELQKIVKGADGIYILHYVMKEADMGDANRQKWIKNLEESSIKGSLGSQMKAAIPE